MTTFADWMVSLLATATGTVAAATLAARSLNLDRRGRSLAPVGFWVGIAILGSIAFATIAGAPIGEGWIR